MRRADFVAVIGGLLVTGCRKTPPPTPPPAPASIALAVQAECREGETVPLSVTVKDAAGDVMDAGVHLAVDPSSGASVDSAALHCTHEGSVQVVATAGAVRASQAVTITSPILGMWARRGDDKDGLTVRVDASADGPIAYVVELPGRGAVPYLKKRVGGISDAFALKCVQKQWALGEKKWRNVHRLSATKWSLSDLGVTASIAAGSDELINQMMGAPSTTTCTVSKAEFTDTYELTLVDPTHLELRDTAESASTTQHWERVEPKAILPDAGAAAEPATSESAARQRTTAPIPTSAASVAMWHTEKTYCPNGLEAHPWRFGCRCGTETGIEAPKPTGGNCVDGSSGGNAGWPDAKGSACVWKCR